MSDQARKVADKLTDAQFETLEDLCGCPGLFAGQYQDLDRLPHELVNRNYGGAGGFLGLAKAGPSDLGVQVCNILLAEKRDG